jgi:hypothetical protein
MRLIVGVRKKKNVKIYLQHVWHKIHGGYGIPIIPTLANLLAKRHL